MTNGDVIMAMFPTIDTYFSNVVDMKLWWNAKYKGTDAEIVKLFIEDGKVVKELLLRGESEE